MVDFLKYFILSIFNEHLYAFSLLVLICVTLFILFISLIASICKKIPQLRKYCKDYIGFYASMKHIIVLSPLFVILYVCMTYIMQVVSYPTWTHGRIQKEWDKFCFQCRYWRWRNEPPPYAVGRRQYDKKVSEWEKNYKDNERKKALKKELPTKCKKYVDKRYELCSETSVTPKEKYECCWNSLYKIQRPGHPDCPPPIEYAFDRARNYCLETHAPDLDADKTNELE